MSLGGGTNYEVCLEKYYISPNIYNQILNDKSNNPQMHNKAAETNKPKES